MKRAAALAVLAAAWLVIAFDVLHGGPLTALDGWLAERLHVPPRSALALAMLFWTNLHSHVAILGYSALLVLILARRRAWGWVLGVALAVPGAMLLNATLKGVIQRTRPVLDNPVLALETYSFPSGHTAASLAFYGMLAAYLAYRFPRQRALLVAGAALAVGLVAYSRMALGVHYFGDVLAALFSTGAWLMICLAGVEGWRGA
ncbi:MAG TPA: phosphatase PAP2 family protein [Burkholderiales bacterium]